MPDHSTYSMDADERSYEIPQHVAVIMDGNGRWAEKRGLARIEGHRKGADAVKTCIETAQKAGVKYLTLFAFSSENWDRPVDEVQGLMNLMRYYLKRETDRLHESRARLEVIGNLSRLDSDLQDMIARAQTITRENSEMIVTLALSYGGRDDIVQAAKKLVRNVNSGALDLEKIDENDFAEGLMTAGFPDPDLLIRTSGEQRLSNFLMWQCAYSEIYFSDVLWPDFGREDFLQALAHYRSCERRFGRLPSKVS